MFSATGPPPPPRVGMTLRCELLARLARAATRFRVIVSVVFGDERLLLSAFFLLFRPPNLCSRSAAEIDHNPGSRSRSLSLDLSLSLARQLRHDVAPRRSPGSATGASAPRPRPAAEDRHARALRSPQRPGIRRVHEGAAAGQRGLRVFGGRGRGELLRFQAARGLGGGLESGGEALG